MLEGQRFEPADRREQLARMFAAFERDDVELAVEMLIERLDAEDGDPDLEANGDERDASVVEFSGRDPLYFVRNLSALASMPVTQRVPDFDDPEPTSDGLPGDPTDAEDGGDTEPTDDAELGAWIERIDQSDAAIEQACNGGAGTPEDQEDDDPDRCMAGEDMVDSGPIFPGLRAGIAGPGSEDDDEPTLGAVDLTSQERWGECGPLRLGDVRLLPFITRPIRGAQFARPTA